MTPSLPEILEQQKAYYRARATEYDQWFYRQGRYDQGAAHTQQWQLEVAHVRQQLYDLQLNGQVLELAAGTGIWTQELIRMADQVTALDYAPEVLEINRHKLNSERVDYLQADLFAWQPTQKYDGLFMGFWLSHVPLEKLDSFLANVAQALKPQGKFFMVDSFAASTSTAKDLTQNLSQTLAQRGEIHETTLAQETVLRRLNDGQEFHIIKHYHQPNFLQARFKAHGLDVTMQQTEQFFIYGAGLMC